MEDWSSRRMRTLVTGISRFRPDEGNPMEKTYAAIRDQLVMTLAAGGFGEEARVINAAVPRFHTRIITVASSSWNNPNLEITPQRPDWLAGAPGFEPGNGGIKIRCTSSRLTSSRRQSSSCVVEANARTFRCEQIASRGR
jgi:hypothetical protein